MDNIDNYVEIMLESLKKKAVILDRIIRKNEAQTECLTDKSFDNVDWDRFNIIVTEKEAEIERINEMDEGFQALYDRVGEQLGNSKDKFKDEIKEMQNLITELESKSVTIRVGEDKNRAMIEKILSGRKTEIRKARTSLKVATNYYKTMQKSFDDGLNSVDKKK